MKVALTERPVLTHPDFEKDFILFTDASERRAGAMLAQEREKGIQPISYFSHKYYDMELKYSEIEKF